MRVGIVGGNGYIAGELLRLAIAHEHCEILHVTSRRMAGRYVHEAFPSLRGIGHLQFCRPNATNLMDCDVVVFSTPAGTAMDWAPQLLEAGVKVLDISPDFRLRNPVQWSYWYKRRHACPDYIDQSVYGLPEIYRDSIPTSNLVANPGCHATAVQIGLAPLVQEGIADHNRLVADVFSGASGAGRNAGASFQLGEASDNTRAYSAPGHRHSAEIQQNLEELVGTPIQLAFVPHVVPQIRGIHATLHVELTEEVDIQKLFEEKYHRESFISVLPAGSYPQTRSIRGSNCIHLSAQQNPETPNHATVMVALDNLIKGGAGQAMQNLNLMFGMDEREGLVSIPHSP